MASIVDNFIVDTGFEIVTKIKTNTASFFY